jgi:nucleoid-associated protein YgaU
VNAEARAWSVAPIDPDGLAASTAPAAGGARAGSPGVRRPPRSASRVPRPAGSDVEDVSWNVLAEELLPFPRSRALARLGEGSDAGGRRDPARDDRKDAERARSYGEAWLERELIAVRYLADAGYPALGRRLTGTVRPPATAQRAAARRATAQRAAAQRATALRAAAQPAALQPAAANFPAVRLATAQAAGGLEISHPERRARDSREAAPTRTGVAGEARGWRRLLPGIATLAALAGLWAGAGMLAAGRHPPLAVLPGSVRTPAGYVYVVRPGDTLWSIATRLQPGGDPRVIVAELESQVRGGTLMPGSRLRLP